MKGPWTWSESGVQLLDGDGRPVLYIRPSGGDSTQEEFDAIAAVPDLFASLKELVDSPDAKENDAWDRARAAIAKVEGK